jgi:S-ribosylhomocysteine lyase
MKLPESFAVDHFQMKALQIRAAKNVKEPTGEIVSKFDLRFVKPRRDTIPTRGIHTLEHCLATVMHRYLEDILRVEEKDNPGLSKKECGNWRNHSLFTAKKYVEMVLEGWWI